MCLFIIYVRTYKYVDYYSWNVAECINIYKERRQSLTVIAIILEDNLPHDRIPKYTRVCMYTTLIILICPLLTYVLYVCVLWICGISYRGMISVLRNGWGEEMSVKSEIAQEASLPNQKVVEKCSKYGFYFKMFWDRKISCVKIFANLWNMHINYLFLNFILF